MKSIDIMSTVTKHLAEALGRLRDSYDDYVIKYDTSISMDGLKLTIEYSLFPYDLIDRDLDHDEYHYQKLCQDFRNSVHSVIKLHILNSHIEVTCMEYRTIFRNKLQLDNITRYVAFPVNQDYVKIIKTTEWNERVSCINLLH